MSNETNDIGVIQVLLERFEKQRLPRINQIKDKLDQGEKLEDFDIEFLSEVLHDIGKLGPTIENHPEYKPLIAKVVHYYKTITDEALNNEK